MQNTFSMLADGNNTNEQQNPYTSNTGQSSMGSSSIQGPGNSLIPNTSVPNTTGQQQPATPYKSGPFHADAPSMPKIPTAPGTTIKMTAVDDDETEE